MAESKAKKLKRFNRTKTNTLIKLLELQLRMKRYPDLALSTSYLNQIEKLKEKVERYDEKIMHLNRQPNKK